MDTNQILSAINVLTPLVFDNVDVKVSDAAKQKIVELIKTLKLKE